MQHFSFSLKISTQLHCLLYPRLMGQAQLIIRLLKLLTVRLFAMYIKGRPAMIFPEKEENLASVPRLLVSVRICVSVAHWLRCCATNRKVAGSIPDGVIGIFH